MQARVLVTLPPSVFDPPGTTVAEALHTLGYAAIRDVRQGKYFELEVDASRAVDARRLAEQAADRLLANTVIESFRVEVVGADGSVAAGAPTPAGARR
jgi:phosphoribosylformylglycinamidine synthase